MKRAKGVCWDSWHRMVALRSLQLMVMNGVVRHATVDPPQRFDTCAAMKADLEAAGSISLSTAIVDEQSWFTRIFRRQAGSPFTHARHTT